MRIAKGSEAEAGTTGVATRQTDALPMSEAGPTCRLTNPNGRIRMYEQDLQHGGAIHFYGEVGQEEKGEFREILGTYAEAIGMDWPVDGVIVLRETESEEVADSARRRLAASPRTHLLYVLGQVPSPRELIRDCLYSASRDQYDPASRTWSIPSDAGDEPIWWTSEHMALEVEARLERFKRAMSN